MEERGPVGEYLDSHEFPPIVDVERLDEDGRIGEQLMLGLRLIDGIEQSALDNLLSTGLRAEARRDALRRAFESGLIESRSGVGMALSMTGLLQADSVIAQLL